MELGCGGCPLAPRILQGFCRTTPGGCFNPAWGHPASRPESCWKLPAELSPALHQRGADAGKAFRFTPVFWASGCSPAPKQMKEQVSETPLPELRIQQAPALCWGESTGTSLNLEPPDTPFANGAGSCLGCAAPGAAEAATAGSRGERWARHSWDFSVVLPRWPTPLAYTLARRWCFVHPH